MKLTKLLLGLAAGVLPLAVYSCSTDEKNIHGDETGTEGDEEYYAARASVSSDDARFAASEDGGTISFATEGGEVALNVECGVEWIVENTATDLFEVKTNASSATVTAGQNTAEQETGGNLTFMTAGKRIKFAEVGIVQEAYSAPDFDIETASWHAPAVGALTVEIAVSASDSWKVASVDGEWLSAEKTGDSTLTLTAGENTGTAERSATVTLDCTDGVRTVAATLIVIQDGRAYITVDEALSFSGNAAQATMAVESNFDWECAVQGDEDWISVAEENGSMLVSVSENDTGEEREAKILVTAGDGAENTAQAEVTVSQRAMLQPLILVYKTSYSNITVTLPLYGTVDCIVDWGDGSEEQTVTSTYPSHTYSVSGEYEVSVTGTVTAIDNFWGGSRTYLIAVKQWGENGLVNLNSAFYNCTNLVSIPETTGDLLAGVTDFKSIFRGCSSLEAVPADLFGHATGIDNLQYAFDGCKSLKAIPAGLLDNCTALTDLHYMFLDCASITTIPEGLFDNCTALTLMDQTFKGCTSLETVPSGLFDNLSAMTSFTFLFDGCSSLKEIPEGIFDHNTKVTTFTYLFRDCATLTRIPEGLFDYCTEVTNFNYVFSGCSGIKQIPDGIFKNQPLAASFSNSFAGCNSLTEIPADLFAYCPLCTSVGAAFSGCTSLGSIPEGLFDKIPGNTSFASVFRDCSSLKSVPEGLFDGFTAVTSCAYIFSGCTSLERVSEGVFDSLTANKNYSYAFNGCTALTSVPAGLFSSGANVTNFQAVFADCSGLKSLPDGLFAGCSKVTSVMNAFQNCTGLTSVPAGLFDDCSGLTSFAYIFSGCTALTGESPYTEVASDDGTVKVHLYERSSYTKSFTKPVNYTDAFAGCTGLEDYYDIPSAWGGGGN